MAKNVGQEIVEGIEKAFDFLKGASEKLRDFGTKVKIILTREKQLAPQFIAAVSTLSADITVLVGEAEAAATEKGLNFEVDSAAFKALQKLIADAKAAVPVVDAAIAALK